MLLKLRIDELRSPHLQRFTHHRSLWIFWRCVPSPGESLMVKPVEGQSRTLVELPEIEILSFLDFELDVQQQAT